MTRLRLIPVVIFATAALLVIKAMGIASGTRSPQIMTVASAPAPVAENAPVPDTDLEFTGATPKKEAPKKEEPALPPAPARAPETPAGIHVGVPGDISPAQKALLERLQQRRQELEAKARDLELRETLIKEAEQRLEQRMNELRALENPPTAENPAASPKMKNLVVMYEGMKPKEAARIFEKLDLAVLVGIARGMKPGKLSEILAVMNPDTAQKVTVELARGLTPERAVPPSDLPRVNLPPPPSRSQALQKQSPPAR